MAMHGLKPHNTYRYAFQGQERDDEIKGAGNSYDFGARMYDGRLGRWLSIDKLLEKYPSDAPYCFAGDSPILFVDTDGNTKWRYTHITRKDGTEIVLRRAIGKGVVSRCVGQGQVVVNDKHYHYYYEENEEGKIVPVMENIGNFSVQKFDYELGARRDDLNGYMGNDELASQFEDMNEHGGFRLVSINGEKSHTEDFPIGGTEVMDINLDEVLKYMGSAVGVSKGRANSQMPKKYKPVKANKAYKEWARIAKGNVKDVKKAANEYKASTKVISETQRVADENNTKVRTYSDYKVIEGDSVTYKVMDGNQSKYKVHNRDADKGYVDTDKTKSRKL